MNDRFTPDADAKTENELAVAGTGATTKDFSDSGHEFQADVQVNELQKVAVGLLTVSAATLKSTLDSVSGLRATNAAVIDNMSQLNAVHLNNLVNSASHRHSEIAADRQWNINETDAYAVILADRIAETLTRNPQL
jgi:hypothetical protein